MPRPCTICEHPRRDAIDLDLASRRPVRRLAAEYRVSDDALARHCAAHLRPGQARVLAFAREQVVHEERHTDDLVEQVRSLHAKALHILETAEQAGDLRTALGGIAQARGCLELLAKLSGELDERPQVNVLVAPEWVKVRSELLGALQGYPDARMAVAARLRVLEAS